ncbi:MAG: Gfo/Idh/MocA family oxidoreductase [Kiritimatiellae bacterium]|nr:Gfo/Idh/MocA family oxidoreductase [Kiritimatiellia bacterium]
MQKQGSSRRHFLGQMLAAGAAAQIVPRHVLGGPGYVSPNSEITRAIIGCGGISGSHLGMNYARIVAFCDVDAQRVKKYAEKCPDATLYRDFREVLARPDIDVVHICTPPHWHAAMSVMAARAGKDVWCEKPLTRTIGEGKKVKAAIREYGRVLRINTWFRFKSGLYGLGSEAAPMRKLVLSGMLGFPLKARVGGHTGFNWKHNWCGDSTLTTEPVPDHLDYDLWLGPAPYKPYNGARVHGRFRGYWDYDGGGLGDMGQHYLDPIQFLMDKDHTSPVEIEADAPPQHPDAVGTWKQVRMKYADGCEIILDGDGSLKNLPFLEGPKGKLYKGFESDIPNLRAKVDALPDIEPVVTDFAVSVRHRKKFALNEENGHRSCTLINLATTAIRLGRPLRYDPVNELFIGDEEANRLLDQPMRGPWHI